MSARTPHRSPLAMVLLALLAEAPAHPYRMQQLIRERRKDKVVNVHRRGSIYQTIDRLLRDELIAVRDVARERGRPERTVYEISQPGRVALRAWLSEMLAAPAAEFPEFPAALAFLPVLEPAEVQHLLERRALAVQQLLDADAAEHATIAPSLPRLFLIEDSYRGALLRAELDWVRGVIDELRSGVLRWDPDWLRTVARQFESSPVAADDQPSTEPR